MAVGSISDMSDAVPGSWFWPSPALPEGAPWYTDMPDGRVVSRVLSQRCGQATTTPARIDDAALDPDRTARLGAVAPQISTGQCGGAVDTRDSMYWGGAEGG